MPNTTNTTGNALPAGTRLDEFEITGVVGEGGFGIVYRAYDESLRRTVAVKEYMPSSLANRGADRSVSIKSDKLRRTFEAGLRSFINEARLLAQFDHPALVKVYRFWEAYGTAYMAMPLYRAKTLRQELVRTGKPPAEMWLRRMLGPLLDALDLLHRAQCFHRDVSPDNILLIDAQRPYPLLLDFGAARRVIGDATQDLTIILKPGYAPIEQYDEIPGLKQGPWTDFYALGAVLHFCITGKAPPPAVGRLVHDVYQPLSTAQQPAYTDVFLQAVNTLLAPHPDRRPRSVADVKRLLEERKEGNQEKPRSNNARPGTVRAQAGEADATAVPVEKTAVSWRRALVGGLALGGLLIGAFGIGLTALNRWQERRLEEATQQWNDIEADTHETLAAPLRTTLQQARDCLAEQRNACALENAQHVLAAHPKHRGALRIQRVARQRLEQVGPPK